MKLDRAQKGATDRGASIAANADADMLVSIAGFIRRIAGGAATVVLLRKSRGDVRYDRYRTWSLQSSSYVMRGYLLVKDRSSPEKSEPSTQEMHAQPTAILRRFMLIAAALIGIFLFLQVQAARAAEQRLPQPDHVVVVIFENHSFDEIVDPKRAPFIFSLATGGALFTHSFAVTHPSQPNYFALFSGSTHGVRDDEDHMSNAPTLASALVTAHMSFIGYVETGSPRKHNPWESFTDTQAIERNLNELPSDFLRLPTVSFVIPNLAHDMHDGSVPDGDNWLKAHLGAYAEWTKTHNSLLIVTFDEDDDSADNHIPTIIYGSGVTPGRYGERITHYSVLSTLLAMYNLPLFANAATTSPISTIWDK